MNLAQTIHRFTDKVLGFLKTRQEAAENQQAQIGITAGRKSSPLPGEALGEPQPICRLLNESADIAEEYSRSASPNGITLESIDREYRENFCQVSERTGSRKERAGFSTETAPNLQDEEEDGDDERQDPSDEYDRWCELE